MQQGGGDVVGHAVGVTPRRSAPADVAFFQTLEVDVLKACGGGADKADRRPLNQFRRHFRFGANDQRIGIGQVLRADQPVGKDLNLAQRFERFAA